MDFPDLNDPFRRRRFIRVLVGFFIGCFLAAMVIRSLPDPYRGWLQGWGVIGFLAFAMVDVNFVSWRWVWLFGPYITAAKGAIQIMVHRIP